MTAKAGSTPNPTLDDQNLEDQANPTTEGQEQTNDTPPDLQGNPDAQANANASDDEDAEMTDANEILGAAQAAQQEAAGGQPEVPTTPANEPQSEKPLEAGLMGLDEVLDPLQFFPDLNLATITDLVQTVGRPNADRLPTRQEEFFEWVTPPNGERQMCRSRGELVGWRVRRVTKPSRAATARPDELHVRYEVETLVTVTHRRPLDGTVWQETLPEVRSQVHVAHTVSAHINSQNVGGTPTLSFKSVSPDKTMILKTGLKTAAGADRNGSGWDYDETLTNLDVFANVFQAIYHMPTQTGNPKFDELREWAHGVQSARDENAEASAGSALKGAMSAGIRIESTANRIATAAQAANDLAGAQS